MNTATQTPHDVLAAEAAAQALTETVAALNLTPARDDEPPAETLAWSNHDVPALLMDVARRAADAALASIDVPRIEAAPTTPTEQDVADGNDTLVRVERSQYARETVTYVVAVPKETAEALLDPFPDANADENEFDEDVIGRGTVIAYSLDDTDERNLTLDVSTVDGTFRENRVYLT